MKTQFLFTYSIWKTNYLHTWSNLWFQWT